MTTRTNNGAENMNAITPAFAALSADLQKFVNANGIRYSHRQFSIGAIHSFTKGNVELSKIAGDTEWTISVDGVETASTSDFRAAILSLANG
jgi:hypothetical protein